SVIQPGFVASPIHAKAEITAPSPLLPRIHRLPPPVDPRQACPPGPVPGPCRVPPFYQCRRRGRPPPAFSPDPLPRRRRRPGPRGRFYLSSSHPARSGHGFMARGLENGGEGGKEGGARGKGYLSPCHGQQTFPTRAWSFFSISSLHSRCKEGIYSPLKPCDRVYRRMVLGSLGQ
ncbi:hypothetical protein Naga_100240g7, partial [Nannochloropsis gaditana]